MQSMMNSSTLISAMPMLMPALQRNRVAGERPPFEAGERGARVGEGVDADAEPRHAVAAGDADQAEDQDDRDLHRVDMCEQHAEVQQDDRPDEDLEDQDELALRDQIRLAGLVDQLGDLAHRAMHRQRLELSEDHEGRRRGRAARRAARSSAACGRRCRRGTAPAPGRGGSDSLRRPAGEAAGTRPPRRSPAPPGLPRGTIRRRARRPPRGCPRSRASAARSVDPTDGHRPWGASRYP